MARSGIIRQHVEPAPPPAPVPQPPPAPPRRPLRQPPPKRGGIYAGEIPVHGVDYEEDGRRLSQNLSHDLIAYYVRDAIMRHCNWLETRDNVVAVDVFIVYKDEGKTVTIAPDVMLAKGPPAEIRPTSAGAREGPRAPVFRPPEPKSYELAEEGRPPDFALEVVSPKNTAAELREKKAKYLKIGIPEYFVFDPFAQEPDPSLKRYRLQHGGEAWKRKTSRVGLRSKELDTDILVNGQTLEVINPKTGQPYEWSHKLQIRAEEEAAARRKADARAEEEAAARRKADARAAEEAAARRKEQARADTEQARAEEEAAARRKADARAAEEAAARRKADARAAEEAAARRKEQARADTEQARAAEEAAARRKADARAAEEAAARRKADARVAEAERELRALRSRLRSRE